jgi:type IV pilus assembly protein PilW
MKQNNQKGFTLIELLVAMTLSLIVLGAVHSVFRVQAHTIKAQEFKMEAQEYARTALDMMVRDVRNLGFFPTLTPCTTVPVNTNGIIAGTATGIQLVYDANNDGLCNGTVATAGADENVTYALAAGDITRSVNGINPQVLTAGNVNSLAFTYYNNAGTVITTGIPANAKRVSIALTVTSLSPDVPFGGAQLITMDSNVDLRNRCFNPAATTVC